MPFITDVPHCRLVTYRAKGQRQFEATGKLDLVTPADRERLAAVLATHLGLTHDDAYALLWSEVKPCLSLPTLKS